MPPDPIGPTTSNRPRRIPVVSGIDVCPGYERPILTTDCRQLKGVAPCVARRPQAAVTAQGVQGRQPVPSSGTGDGFRQARRSQLTTERRTRPQLPVRVRTCPHLPAPVRTCPHLPAPAA